MFSEVNGVKSSASQISNRQINLCVSRKLTAVLAALFFIASSAVYGQQPAQAPTQTGLKPILGYISTNWDKLTRSMTSCESIVDPKMQVAPVLYLPADFPNPAAVTKLQADCKVDVEHLSRPITALGQIDMSTIHQHGLLYLPNKYVVPGGRFNEMYGWDSYFTIRGLLEDGRLDLAQGMVENFFFEIEHYGALLNANRTYYLTRSHPPFLSSAIMAIYDAQKKSGKPDKAWLERAYGYLQRDHALWTHEPHLAGDTGLSRYYDFGSGPPPEGLQDESGFYRRVIAYFVEHPDTADHYLIPSNSEASATTYGAKYSIQVCDVATTMAHPGCETQHVVTLSNDYYKGDRSMRESGYDISFRFGPYGAGTHHFAPICLNSLLYKAETDLATIARTLGKNSEAEEWTSKAAARKAAINKYLWDEQRGMFFDYDFEKGERSTYIYVTTFFPLWAGLVTPEQAKKLVANLPKLEQPGGVAMSTSAQEAGVQWEYPWGWAPTHLPTVEGLRRYGFNDEANRISYKFLTTVANNFRREGFIREKYNVVTGSSEATITAGYQANVIGFGWTNGVFLVVLHALPAEMVDKLSNEQQTQK
jgi:alpha,alpha-trehalase